MALYLVLTTLGLLGSVYVGYLIAARMRFMPRRRQALVLAALWVAMLVPFAVIMRGIRDEAVRLALSCAYLAMAGIAMLPTMVFFGGVQRPSGSGSDS